MSILRYVVERKDHTLVTEYEFGSIGEARKLACDSKAFLIEREYSFEDSQMLEDYTEPDHVCVACGVGIEYRGLVWEDTDYPEGSDEARDCPESGNHLHAPSDEKEGDN